MSGALVSVAIATYNGGRYLEEQLDSIYAQTWTNLDVVASDDASTDDTVGILSRYARTRGLRYSANAQRVGLVRNFERAMALAQGEFIALSDQDDIWKPEKVATLVEYLGDATLIYGNCQEVRETDGRTRIASELDPIYRFMRIHGSGSPTRYLAAENWVVSHTVMFRRKLLEHALPIPPNQPYHDAWLAFVASLLGGIRYLDRALQVYRRHPHSYTYRIAHSPAAARSEVRRAFWDHAAHESARLSDALACPLVSPADRGFLHRLLEYYRAGMERGHRWSSFLAGISVAPYFHTAIAGRGRWKIPLRPLLRGR